MNAPAPLYLDHVAICCALGDGLTAVREAAFAAQAPDTLTRTDRYSPGRVLPVGQVPAALPSLAHVPANLRSRNNALLAHTLRAIRHQADAVISRFGPHRVGIVLGTSTSGMSDGEDALAQHACNGIWPAGFTYDVQELGSPARFLARELGVSGPAYVVSTACSSSAKALASAARMLRTGIVDAVITGGCDTLCRLTVGGFSALESVSDERCNPLSANRKGINLGEGAALFIMSLQPGPARLSGWGETSDAHHMSAPDPTGQGAAEAMRQALKRTGIAGSELDYINLHGTATPQNDAMESLAVAEVAGLDVPCSSTKSLTGHALGASGAIEAALAWMTVVGNPQGRLPGHVFDGQRDPALPAISVATPGTALGRAPRHVLSNSFAFGGSNASLVISAA